MPHKIYRQWVKKLMSKANIDNDHEANVAKRGECIVRVTDPLHLERLDNV